MPANETNAQPAPSYWPDRLRNLATAMVVLIHVAAPIAHAAGADFDSSKWWAGNFWNSISRAGVPLFVMLSGYLLLGKDYPLGDFLRKRFSRVAVPALFWMLVYSYYGHLAKGKPATWEELFRNIITGPVHYHLWFIYLILGLYLVYPILRPWVRAATDRDFLYFFLLCAIGTWGYKMSQYFFQLKIGIMFELVTNHGGYFVLGYFLGNRVECAAKGQDMGRGLFLKQEGRWLFRAWLPAVFIVVGTAVTLLASYWVNTGWAHEKNQIFFYDYLTPNVSMAATGWFLLAKTAMNRSPLLDVERSFAAVSFGIYLVHVLVMDWWGIAGYRHSTVDPWCGVPALAFMVMAMSFLATSLIRALPGGGRVV